MAECVHSAATISSAISIVTKRSEPDSKTHRESRGHLGHGAAAAEMALTVYEKKPFLRFQRTLQVPGCTSTSWPGGPSPCPACSVHSLAQHLPTRPSPGSSAAAPPRLAPGRARGDAGKEGRHLFYAPQFLICFSRCNKETISLQLFARTHTAFVLTLQDCKAEGRKSRRYLGTVLFMKCYKAREETFRLGTWGKRDFWFIISLCHVYKQQ